MHALRLGGVNMRQSCRVGILAILFPITTLVLPSFAQMTSNNYQITASVISGGGGCMSSSSYALTGTLGQPSSLDTTISPSFELRSGFWETVTGLTMRKMGLTPGILLLLLGE